MSDPSWTIPVVQASPASPRATSGTQMGTVLSIPTRLGSASSATAAARRTPTRPGWSTITSLNQGNENEVSFAVLHSNSAYVRSLVSCMSR